MSDPQPPPLVTYVIVALNEEAHIGKLLGGIAAQRHRPIEVLVIDGGSRDRTREVVLEHAAKHAKENLEIRLLKEEDHGPLRSAANARNIGISASRGAFLIILDADFFMVDDDFTGGMLRALAEQAHATARVEYRPQTAVEEYFAALQTPVAAIGYRREAFEGVRYDPHLGYGEDVIVWKLLGVDMRDVCDATIGRHVPQSWHEHYAQLRWYGRTFPRFLRAARPLVPPSERLAFYIDHVWNRVPRALFYVGAPVLILALLPFAWPVSVGLALLYGGLLARNYMILPARGKVPSAFTMMCTQLLVGSAAFLVGLGKGLLKDGPASRD